MRRSQSVVIQRLRFPKNERLFHRDGKGWLLSSGRVRTTFKRIPQPFPVSPNG